MSSKMSFRAAEGLHSVVKGLTNPHPVKKTVGALPTQELVILPDNLPEIAFGEVWRDVFFMDPRTYR